MKDIIIIICLIVGAVLSIFLTRWVNNYTFRRGIKDKGSNKASKKVL